MYSQFMMHDEKNIKSQKGCLVWPTTFPKSVGSRHLLLISTKHFDTMLKTVCLLS